MGGVQSWTKSKSTCLNEQSMEKNKSWQQAVLDQLHENGYLFIFTIGK